MPHLEACQGHSRASTEPFEEYVAGRPGLHLQAVLAHRVRETSRHYVGGEAKHVYIAEQWHGKGQGQADHIEQLKLL